MRRKLKYAAARPRRGHPWVDLAAALLTLRSLQESGVDPSSDQWSEPVKTIRRALVATALRIFQSPRFRTVECDAEHVAQEWFARWFEIGSRNWKPDQPIFPYAYRMLVNICRTMLRRARHRGAHSLKIDVEDDRTNPARQFDRKQNRLAVRAAERKLNPDERSLLCHRHYQCRSAREAAAKRGLNPSQVDRRMSVIYRKLRKSL